MEDKEKYIGVMDSGIGGLTVLKQLLNIRPQEKYLYFGDTKNLPYGEKSKEELIKIVKEIFDFFETQNVKAVVLACNTSSATAYEELQDNYSFKIYPLIQEIRQWTDKPLIVKPNAGLPDPAHAGHQGRGKRFRPLLRREAPAGAGAGPLPEGHSGAGGPAGRTDGQAVRRTRPSL